MESTAAGWYTLCVLDGARLKGDLECMFDTCGQFSFSKTRPG